MIFFYSIAVIPILIGLVLWAKKQEVVWWEWIGSSVIALLMAAIFHWAALRAQCEDYETFSGRMLYATHHPYWQSREKVDDYEDEDYTDSDGNHRSRRVKSGYHYEYTDHPEFWDCEAEFGSYIGTKTYNISQEFFLEISRNFCLGKLDVETPHKSDFYKGDKNEYVARNKTDFCYPMTTQVYFENRVKACPSLYSYAPVPVGTPIFPYPANADPFQSSRLVGTAAKTVGIRSFDVFSSKLGPMKKINVIMIGFGNADSELAHYQEAAWIGGKKNDLVLCYGGPDPLRPTWSYVFGWSESTLAKANLQTILLQNAINVSILPLLHKEIVKNYEIKDWKKFSYLQVDPPPWSYWVYILAIIFVQGGFWYWAHANDIGKNGSGGNSSGTGFYDRSQFKTTLLGSRYNRGKFW